MEFHDNDTFDDSHENENELRDGKIFSSALPIFQ